MIYPILFGLSLRKSCCYQAILTQKLTVRPLNDDSQLQLLLVSNESDLNCIYSAKNDTWHRRQAWQSFITAEHHA